MLGIRLLLEAAFHQHALSFQDTLGRMSEDTVTSSDCLVPLNKDGIWFSYNLPNTDERPLLRNTCTTTCTKPLASSTNHEMYHLYGASCSLTKPGGGVLPYKRVMGMCRWMGSHFHDWIDYDGRGRIFNRVIAFGFFGVRLFFIFTVSKRTRMFVLQMKSKVFLIQ